MPSEIFNLIKILTLSTAAFIIAIAWTPGLSLLLYKYKLFKQIRTKGVPIFAKLHKRKQGTPTMGGILIWGTVLVLILIFWVLSQIGKGTFLQEMNFLTRSQTLLPLGILVFAALVGLVDDLMGVLRIGPNGGGLKMRHRIWLYTFVAAIGASWFYFKLDWDLLHIPFLGDFNIGIWYIPLFVFIIVASAFSMNETDGLDGLAGGVALVAFGALGVIAYSQGKIDLAAFCAAIGGALIAFLWFNVYPARFFMGDTGSMSLGVTLGVITMLTNSVFLLPFIGFILALESLSVIVQTLSKKLRGRKIFLSTPLHHHFEAIGWPETKVTMRFWIIAGVMAAIGLIVGLVGG